MKKFVCRKCVVNRTYRSTIVVTLVISSMFVFRSAFAECPYPNMQNFDHMSFAGCDIRDWNFQESMTFVGANFFESKLIGANLSGIDFSYAVFIKSKLSDTSLRATNFTNAYFHAVDMSNIVATNADFRNAIIWNVDFSRANLDGANFTGSQMWGTSFDSVSAKRANFSGSDLTHTNFRDADLGGAIVCGATMPVDFIVEELSHTCQ